MLLIESVFFIALNVPAWGLHQVHAAARWTWHGTACVSERLVGKKCAPFKPLPKYHWVD